MPIDEGYCDCDGVTEIEHIDCTGVCGGGAHEDDCGGCFPEDTNELGVYLYDWNDGEGYGKTCDCNGNIWDCEGVCGGTAELDEFGICINGGQSNVDMWNSSCDECVEIDPSLPCGSVETGCLPLGLCGDCNSTMSVEYCEEPYNVLGIGNFQAQVDATEFKANNKTFDVTNIDSDNSNAVTDIFQEIQEGNTIPRITMPTTMINQNSLISQGQDSQGNNILGYRLPVQSHNWSIKMRTTNGINGEVCCLYPTNARFKLDAVDLGRGVEYVNFGTYNNWQNILWQTSGTIKESVLFNHINHETIFQVVLAGGGQGGEDENREEPTTNSSKFVYFTIRLSLEYNVDSDFPIDNEEQYSDYWYIINEYKFKRYIDIPVRIAQNVGSIIGFEDEIIDTET